MNPISTVKSQAAFVNRLAGRVGPPEHPRCEYLTNPLGVDQREPRLSWELRDPRRGTTQTAYQVLVADAPGLLREEVGNLWDTGKVASEQTRHIRYAGKPLLARQQVWWQVRVWDNRNEVSAWSQPATWSMGLLESADWHAHWIGAAPGDPILPLGYRSVPIADDSVEKSIVFTLSAVARVDEIILHPALPADGEPLPLPSAYRIELANQPDFSDAVTAVAHTATDDNPAAVRIHEFEPHVAGFVRLTAERLAPTGDGRYALILGGLQILAANENLTCDAQLVATDSDEEDGWSLNHLVSAAPRWRQPQLERPAPPPLLRKSFSVAADQRIRRATVYASALGLYALRINGQTVGERALAPEWTDYNRRIQYQTYDVTDLILTGDNAIGIMLAHGWYAGRVGLTMIVPDGPTWGLYGDAPCTLLQLEIEYADGHTERILSDDTWRLTQDGPIRAADLLDGEWYDARRACPGWDRPGFDDSAWSSASLIEPPAAPLVPQCNEPIRKIHEITPVKLHSPRPGVYIFDLGQEISGWCRLRVKGLAGATIKLRHAEMLTEDGELYLTNLRRAAQLDCFVLAGRGEEICEPQFTYHGFRYVEVRGLEAPPQREDLVGCAVCSAAPHVGEFACSSDLLNRLWRNIYWTLRDNMHSIPTDCPQRDERLGWTGDSTAIITTACTVLDVAAFYRKWLFDLRDAQLPDGRLPDFAPHPYDPAVRFANAPGWGDVGTVAPWTLYRVYGDTQVLAESYDCARRWVDWIHTTNPELLWVNQRGNDYGDWLNADTLQLEAWPERGAEVPKDVFATAFFAHSAALVAKMARVLDKHEDAQRYGDLAESIRRAFNDAYVDKAGRIKGDTQAGYAIALHFDLLPEAQRPAAAQRMVEVFERFDGQISTGFFSTSYLMHELTRWGYVDEAYRLITNRKMPSWGYTIDQGATTIWERWDGYVAGRGFQDPGMNSFCHFSLGSVGEWMMRTIAGINLDPIVPAYRHFTLRPLPGGELDWARGVYRSMYGPIGCAWWIEDDELFIDVVIPPNTSATFHLPPAATEPITESDHPIGEAANVTRLPSDAGPRAYSLPAGRYQFKMGWSPA